LKEKIRFLRYDLGSDVFGVGNGIFQKKLTNDTIYDIILSGGDRMPSVDKIVDKMKRQPNGIRIEEAHRVLKYYGYRLDRQEGSHRQYINGEGKVLTVVERKPTIKAVYVKKILERINQ